MAKIDKHIPKLYNDVCKIIEESRYRIATTVNAEVCLMNWSYYKLQHCVRSAYIFRVNEIVSQAATQLQ